MAQRYFHKVQPGIAIILSTGHSWKGWTVIDHHNGVAAPQSDLLVTSLDLCVKQGVGGVTEISKADYDEWLKKKLTVLPRQWRDEWVPRASKEEPAQSQSTEPSPSGVAAGVVGSLRPTAVKE